MAKATIIHHSKVYLVHESQDLEAVIEMKIWKIPLDPKYPEGIKYSFYCVRNGEVVVGFDNHHPKGHHLHVGLIETPYAFVTYEHLIADFLAEIAKFGFNL